ncbi:hypothetical protein H2248_002827 [Termitomyces sp. 'cryptogamus']|nr:hypothetical protein H2248_002827 [Termitomyces sp. 'cryptogamus']
MSMVKTGPLQQYHHVGKLILCLLSSFLNVDAISVHGLVNEGLLDPSCCDMESDDMRMNDVEETESEERKTYQILQVEQHIMA